MHGMESSKNKHYIEFIEKPDKILSEINPINETKSQPELRSSDKLAEGLADGLLKYESHFEEYKSEIDDELDGLKLDDRINLSYLPLFAYNSQDKSSICASFCRT